jgi:hypothetical protein
MKEVTKDLMIEKTRTRGKSIFDAASKDTRKLAAKCFENLGNFSKLRDPLAWAQVAGLEETSSVPEVQLDIMLHHCAETVAESFTIIDDQKEKEAAVNNFTNLLRCMGDKPSITIGDKEEPILKCAKKGGSLCDEVFVQVVKQLTQNPSVESATAGWMLFQKLCESKETRPSEELSEFVRGFLERESAAPKAEGKAEEVKAEVKAEEAGDASPKGSPRGDRSPQKLRNRTKTFSALADAESRRPGGEQMEAFEKNKKPELARDTLTMFLAANAA